MYTEFDLVNHLHRMFEWAKIKWPFNAPESVVEHLEEELQEIREDITDPLEWIDVINLAFDGLMRLGYTPEECVKFLEEKQSYNETRTDWDE